MNLIVNQAIESENAKCYITILDEHFVQNLLTIYGQEKTVAIIENGKKYDDKYQVIANYENLICRFEFHPTRGLLMTAYDFNNSKIDNNDDSFKIYLKENNLTNHFEEIKAIKLNPTSELKIEMIGLEQFLFDKFK